VDRYVYNNKANYTVKALDTFQTLQNNVYNNEVYIVDLDYFLEGISSIKNILIDDNYQKEVLYYGAILKYWPFLTLDFFQNYLEMSESQKLQLRERYPYIDPPKYKIQDILSRETKIINDLYINNKTTLFNNIENSIKLSVVNINLSFIDELPKNINIDIRNLFDKLGTDDTIVKLIGYINYNNVNYKIIKEDILFMKKGRFKSIKNPFLSYGEQEIKLINSLNIVISRKQYNKFVYININSLGKVQAITDWYDEDYKSIESAIEFVSGKVNKVIEKINTFGKSVFINPVFTKIPTIKKNNYKILNLNMAIFWPQSMTVPNFRYYRSIIKEYSNAEITIPYLQQKPETITFKFRKGMTTYDKIFSYRLDIQMINQYIYLNDPSFHARWKTLFGGKKVIITHRVSDIKYELINTDEEEYNLILDYIINSTVLYKKSKEAKIERKSVGSEKKLKRLREKDPELFNLKKYGSPIVYARFCQSQFQPDIILKSEYLKNKNKKNYFKFWNFTDNKEEYYKCPNSKFPYVSFRPDMHPKNYCLPCCKMHEVQKGSKKENIKDNCLSKYIFDPDEIKNDGTISRHILKYGTILDVSRMSLLNNNLKQILCDQVCDLYLYGVNQKNYYLSIISIVENKDKKELLKDMLNILKKILREKDYLFDSILNGIVKKYFLNPNELYDTIENIFINNKNIFTAFSDWNKLFIELFIITNKIYPIYFIDENPSDNSNPYLDIYPKTYSAIMSGINDAKYIIICELKYDNIFYYPIFNINKVNKDINYTYYNFNNNELSSIIDIIKKYTNTDIKLKTKEVNLLDIINLSKNNNMFDIEKKYINNKDFCYAVMLKNGIYLPIAQSIYAMDKIPLEYNVFIRKDNDIKFKDLKKIIEILKIKITHNIYLNNEGYIGVIDNYNKYYYCNVSDKKYYSDLPDKKILYDFTEVNKIIINNKNKKNEYKHSNNIPKILYEHYLYKLLLIEFNNHIGKYKDMNKRKYISKIIKDHSIKKEFKKIKMKLSKELDYEDLKKVIILLINYYYGLVNKDILIEQIKSLSYNFDKNIIIDIIKTGESKLKEIVLEICEVKPELEDINDFPNILIPCSTGVKVDYCNKKKLVIPNKLLDKFISILYNDIKVEMREVNVSMIRNYFKFRQSETENIIIDIL